MFEAYRFANISAVLNVLRPFTIMSRKSSRETSGSQGVYLVTLSIVLTLHGNRLGFPYLLSTMNKPLDYVFLLKARPSHIAVHDPLPRPAINLFVQFEKAINALPRHMNSNVFYLFMTHQSIWGVNLIWIRIRDVSQSRPLFCKKLRPSLQTEQEPCVKLIRILQSKVYIFGIEL